MYSDSKKLPWHMYVRIRVIAVGKVLTCVFPNVTVLVCFSSIRGHTRRQNLLRRKYWRVIQLWFLPHSAVTCDLFCFAIETETIPGNVLELRCVESRENHMDSFKKIFHLQSSF